jgi:uncharacterized membrane protein
MMNALRTPTAQLVAGLLLGAAVFVAFAIGGDLGSAFVSAGIVVAFVLVVHFGRRRSQALEVMGGIGDERTRHLYAGATAFAGSVMAFVLPGWWLVTVAQGDPNETLAVLCAVFAVVWVGAAIVLPRRS